ncbi:prolyl oligopeptidase family serine peptidase [Dyadobacter flavalbus]|uniref:Prolyl oligopeptidase family serine peptidase n=1 Tax=Dyadobacter flavalbus TaxID=2579942 RepID=A0A5M8R168_9BACT|nr:DPP IV N-terminal domain-containing protein [Dyadobacter flavalbus]KAA6441358.1 prolyl oligopeptidase family serine peptidase [Dyadobacter flavalbus]
MKQIFKTFILTFLTFQLFAQIPDTFQWLPDGSGYRDVAEDEIIEVALPSNQPKTILTKAQLTPAGTSTPLSIRSYTVSKAGDKVLIYTNTKRVWRYDTRGDYWLFDMASKSLRQLGKGLPASSLMFAKFSPDGKKAAYVSNHNVYAEDLQSGQVKQLTTDGTDRIINGTFDWAYEEEFDCRDGFRWSDDSKAVAYWQLDARKIRNFLMINTTDSIYSFNVPVEYPKVGETPSPYKIGVVDIASAQTKWMNIPGDPQNTYVPRMEWSGQPNELVIQQLNRKQNESTLFYINTADGSSRPFYSEKDEAFIDIKSRWEDDPVGWDWINNGKEFLWVSEKDGWRHTYRVSRDGKKETLITVGNYDMIHPVRIDEKNNAYYFIASPDNATQSYLYKTSLDGKGKTVRLSPADQTGSHNYEISPLGKFGKHSFSNARLAPMTEWISLPDHKAIDPANSISQTMMRIRPAAMDIEFFKIKTEEGVEVDAWMVKPSNFDPAKKYPIVFTVYGEPAGSTVKDVYGTGRNRLYAGSMAEDGYIYASMDNRGTPSPKGRAWRKAIYRNIGTVNIKDMDGAATAMFKKYPFIDTSRVAVHGWSGGGSSTLNLLFQYPQHFKTGIAVAAVGNQLTYDNIYQERYMGIPQENREDFVKGSPITHAKNLRGNLLYIHGTGDDNVHYQNAEMLVNELIKNNKVFQFMPYPNRSHGIYEGEGTSLHLRTLFTDYLKKNCPPGAR